VREAAVAGEWLAFGLCVRVPCVWKELVIHWDGGWAGSRGGLELGSCDTDGRHRGAVAYSDALIFQLPAPGICLPTCLLSCCNALVSALTGVDRTPNVLLLLLLQIGRRGCSEARVS
jgi:hypothetical protein